MKYKYNLLILVRARNEEKHIQGFLDHCGKISDGVILLDDHSTDKTLSIAKNHPYVIHAFESFSNDSHDGVDWNSLLTITTVFTSKWVLILDVDERLEEQRFLKYKDQLLSNKKVSAYGFLWVFVDKSNMCSYCVPGKLPRKKTVLIKHDCVEGCWYPLTEKAHHVKPSIKQEYPSLMSNIRIKHFVEIRTAREMRDKYQRRNNALKNFENPDPLTIALQKQMEEKMQIVGPDTIADHPYIQHFEQPWKDNDSLKLKLQVGNNSEILKGMF